MDFYNESNLQKLVDSFASSNIEEGILFEKYLDEINTLCITDVDGTYINTNGALRDAQAIALSKISGMNYVDSYAALEKNGLKNVVEQYMSLDDFFSGPYKTFDPVKATLSGQMNVFDDALRFTKSGVPTVAISNSSEKATRAKLFALGIENEFVGIHAAFLKDEAKPNLYLAEKAIKELDEKGWYNANKQIIHVGDQEYDVKFGHNIKQIHPNTVSVLIDRNDTYKGNTKADYVIKSFDDLNTI